MAVLSLGRGKLQPPKSENSVRNFTISPDLCRHIKTYLAEHWRENEEGLLFPNEAGHAYDNTNVVKFSFKPLLKDLGIPQIKGMGLHALRHGNATAMDRLNTPLKVRMGRLGHSRLATTSRYTHIASEDDKRVSEELGKMLCPRTIQ